MSDATFEKTLTHGDAIRLSGSMAFYIMPKPAGSLCNLDCKYCYYLDMAEIYGGKKPRMNEAMLEKVVQEYINGAWKVFDRARKSLKSREWINVRGQD